VCAEGVVTQLQGARPSGPVTDASRGRSVAGAGILASRVTGRVDRALPWLPGVPKNLGRGREPQGPQCGRSSQRGAPDSRLYYRNGYGI
jgi:hypothetical protein